MFEQKQPKLDDDTNDDDDGDSGAATRALAMQCIAQMAVVSTQSAPAQAPSDGNRVVGESLLVDVWKELTMDVGQEAGGAFPDDRCPKLLVLRNFLSKEGTSQLVACGAI